MSHKQITTLMGVSILLFWSGIALWIIGFYSDNSGAKYWTTMTCGGVIVTFVGVLVLLRLLQLASQKYDA